MIRRRYSYAFATFATEASCFFEYMLLGARLITYATMRTKLGPQLISWALDNGYAAHAEQGPSLRQDSHVTYCASWYGDQPAAYLIHKGRFHVWLAPEEWRKKLGVPVYTCGEWSICGEYENGADVWVIRFQNHRYNQPPLARLTEAKALANRLRASEAQAAL